ncbi:glycosyl transferase [Rhizobium sp. R634]|uniref:trifunctional glycosyltransferase/class I SAM-dependent methyltransferase/polysaccharide deacetylase n=1 Tax=Rhizobium sp. R634 TaxID=1764274 RepID=UPI000B52D3F8|nr:trifunctional glycosyltransferase/class I SAM-dependent methyltransferase/polysaccharide deacetylase [Rhizobium sp. R634]OWV79645.1 glycosyl transferase [Rhizobium sp. R634]
MVTAPRPAISFLIPAFNAAATLADCLGSLKNQTITSWQAVVVDDGSRDETWEVLEKIARADSRITIHRQQNGGAAAARNAAAELALAPLLCMLDADDWLDPAFIETMLPIAKDQSKPLIAHCSYRRVTADGRMLKIEDAPDLTGDRAISELSSFCALAIHTAVFPRSLFKQIGGMDASLQTCEDWDLWLRMAFAEARFQSVDKCLAFYRMKEGSLSADPVKMVRDAVFVTKRAQALQAEHGLPTQREDAAWLTPALSQLRMLVWVASANLCPEDHLTELARILPEFPDASGSEDLMALVILHGLQTGRLVQNTAELVDVIDAWAPTVAHLLSLIESHSFPGTARKIEQLIAWRLSSEALSRSFRLGRVQTAGVDARHLAPISKAAEADTLLLQLSSGQEHIGTHVGPLWGDLSVGALVHLIVREMHAGNRLPAPVTFAYARDWSSEVVRNYRGFLGILRRGGRRRGRLRRLVRSTHENALIKSSADGGRNNGPLPSVAKPVGEPHSAVAAEHPENQTGKNAVPSEAVSKEEYWERVFERPDPWNYLSVYEQVKYEQTLSLVPEGIGKALELACAEGIFSAKLARKVGTLTATDISRRAIERASQRCRESHNAEFRVLDFAGDDIPGGQDLIVCSEVLYYMDDEKVLERVCRKIAAALKPDGYLITAHAHLRRDEPDRTGFDWSNPFGIGTIRKILSELPELALEETIETELYAIHRFRKRETSAHTTRVESHGVPLETDVAKHIIWGPAGVDRAAAWSNETATSVPVLMYHRISDEGPDRLRRYRIAPDVFRQQMQFLRRQGYYTLTADGLAELLRAGKPIQGRPVVLTFDDAYLDFLANAFPILAENGFGADVFVVTDKVGGRSDWDASYGEPAALMSWNDIEELHRQGVRFGSHLASHRPASALDNSALLAEAALSRNMLENRLGAAVSSIALPYGSTDFRVPGILAEAGYEIGFTTRPAKAELFDNVLSLPRLEVRGDLPIKAFAEMMGQAEAFIG